MDWNTSFQLSPFTASQITMYLKNAERDLRTAIRRARPDVRFSYAYTALIKSGIALIAGVKGRKVRGIREHDRSILEGMREILHDDLILIMGNEMLDKRNDDLYEGGAMFTEDESRHYLQFVRETFKRIQTVLKGINAREKREGN